MKYFLVTLIALIIIGCGSSNPNPEALVQDVSTSSAINLKIDSTFQEDDVYQIRDAMSEWNLALNNYVFVESNTGGMSYNWELHPSGEKSIAGQMTVDGKSVVLFSQGIGNDITIKSVTMHEIGHIILAMGSNPTHLDHGLMSSGSDGKYNWDCIDSYTVGIICETTQLCGKMAKTTC